MANLAAVQAELQCDACAGQCSYDPSAQALVCDSCGTAYGLESPWDGRAAQEYIYDPEDPEADRQVTFDTAVHHCQTCGGDVTFVGAALSERCAYCNGPVVLEETEQGYESKALIPFEISRTVARSAAEAWVARRIAAPSDLGHAVAQGRMAGIYVPFWTFDSDEAVQYWAKYRVRQGKKTRVRRVQGRMQIQFDDLLVPASPHVTPLIRDGILHDFDPARLRPYRPGYLAGFAAERHHQSVAEGLTANEADKDLLIRNRIKQHVNRSGVHGIRYQTDTTGIRYRRILLPVWILHYDYAGRAQKVVVCGMQGQTFGKRPFSYWKLGIYAAILSLATILFGLFWGAAGLL